MIKKFCDDVTELKKLLSEYKLEIGEDPPTAEQLKRLKAAIDREEILFFVAYQRDKLVGMCSISRTFSTFNCEYSGVFEDFYVLPEFRGQNIGKDLVEFVFQYCKENSIATLWVGCSECDVEMYKHLGFKYHLGNLLTWVKN